MIKRYSRKELTDIWSEENKYQIWLDVEVAAAEAMEKLGQIPKGVASIVRKKAKINVNRIHKIESEVKHDVIAFLTSVTEKAGIKARYLHQGMTSSDVLDTSFNILIALIIDSYVASIRLINLIGVLPIQYILLVSP